MFGEGVVSTADNEFSTTFTPDARTVFWTVSAPSVFEYPFAIVMSRRENGAWGEPKVAPFSGTWMETRRWHPTA